MNLYHGADAAYYDSYLMGVPGDAAFYVAEAKKAGGPVLELGCGTGRILIPVAEAGVSIVGLDRSSAMLAITKRKTARLDAETQEHIALVEGDMRDFALGQRFNLVMIPYRSFLHLLTVDDQRQALGCIREHLADDGHLVLNFFDPRADLIAACSGLSGASLHKLHEFDHPDTGRRVVVWDTAEFDPESQMIVDDFLFEELDARGVVRSKMYSRLIIRYVYRYEMQHLLELCGYHVEALYGDFDRGPFFYGGEQIWVARRR